MSAAAWLAARVQRRLQQRSQWIWKAIRKAGRVASAPCWAAAAVVSWQTPATAGFVDATAAVGLAYQQHALNESPACLLVGGLYCEPERMTGGAATGDVDGDGDPDLFVVDNGAGGRLYRNDDSSGNHWLRVRLEGSRSNRHGLGARITLRTRFGGPAQVREVGTSAHFLGQSETTAHFGVGSATIVDRIDVWWPASGARQILLFRGPDQTLVVREPARACGLLGIEPLVVAAGLWWRRRRARHVTIG